MGDTSHARWFALLNDVTRAASAANTRRVLTGRVAEAISGHLPLVRLELGWKHREDPAPTVVTTTLPDGRTQESRIPLAAALTAAPGEETILLALADPENPENAGGFARLTMTMTAERDEPPEAVIETLARILAFAQRHCLLVERMAKMTSTAHRESQDLREELRRRTDTDGLVAVSAAMRFVIERADLAAPHDTTVLLRGESGTGKELIARRIHRLSRRAKQPFVAVNCGALPEALVESELFGHEKGAFTGAAARYRGRFERAHNGTLFLDEIAELPAVAQVKLLRVLQQGEFERLGGEETLRVHVRVLAATHQPLEERIRSGAFRQDLFYRLDVFPLAIPPLRERPEDIPALAQALLAEAAKRLACPLPSLGTRALAKLIGHPWPGNVRELANALERALIVEQADEGTELELWDLVSPSSAKERSGAEAAATFADAARSAIQTALDASGGKIYGSDGAAARLGMPPSTLQGKMRRLKMRLSE